MVSFKRLFEWESEDEPVRRVRGFSGSLKTAPYVGSTASKAFGTGHGKCSGGKPPEHLRQLRPLAPGR